MRCSSRPGFVSVALSIVALAGSAAAQEVIGPWQVQSAPIAARALGNQPQSNYWLNVVNTPVTFNQAFTGMPIVHDGWANLPINTTVEMDWASGDAVNRAGDDLVLFDARFSQNSYNVYIDIDGFTTPYTIAPETLLPTGVSRMYHFGANPFGPLQAQVMAAPIDLSYWGVAIGAHISAVRVVTLGAQADFLGVGALVPAPSAPSLLGLGSVLVLRRRR